MEKEKKKVGRPLGRKNKVVLSIDDDLYNTLKSIADSSETKMATLIYSILSDSREHFKELEKTLLAVRNGALDVAKKKLGEMAENAEEACAKASAEVEKIQGAK